MTLTKHTLTLTVNDPDRPSTPTPLEGKWRVWLDVSLPGGHGHALALDDTGAGIGGEAVKETVNGTATFQLVDTEQAGFEPSGAYYRAYFSSTNRSTRFPTEPFLMDGDKNLADILITSREPVTPSLLAEVIAARNDARGSATAAAGSATSAAASATTAGTAATAASGSATAAAASLAALVAGIAAGDFDGAPGPGVLAVDNGDGTVTITVDPDSPFTLVDNGDGTVDISLAGQTVTVGGTGGGGGGGSTTDASLLTSGILPAARIADGSIADAKLASGTSLTTAERTKLTGVASGATANSTDATLLARANHTGTESADVLTDGTTNKAFLATERTKLSGIATAATANSADATLLARANHTGTQTAATVSDFSTAADARITAATGVTVQPLDSDLTAIAALTTTTYGRSLLALADASAGRTSLGLGTAATTAASAYDAAGAAAAAQAASQPLDSDLTAIAALTTTSFGRGLLALADAAAGRTTLGLGTAAVAATGDFDAAGAAAAAQAAAVQRANHTGTQAESTVTNLVSDLAARALALTRTGVKTANYTAALWDLVACDTSGGAFTVTLPAASGGKGRIAIKLATAGNTLNLALTGTDHFNSSTGATTGTLTLTSQGIIIESDGVSVWTVTADDIPLSQLDTRFQPLDSDLTAIAALTTTTFGRGLLALADAAATRTALGLGTAATVDTGTSSGNIPLLSTGGVLPIARLATGTPTGSKFVRDDGTLATPAGGGSVATDVIFDAKGDLPVGTGVDTAAKLAVGADGYGIVADSTQATGIKWAPRTRVADEVHADTTIVNTTAETDAVTLAIPTSVSAGDLLRLTVWADSLANAGAAVGYTFRFKIGATTVITTGSVTGGINSLRRRWRIQFEVMVANPTSEERVTGFIVAGGASASTAQAFGTANNSAPLYGTAVEDLTAGKNMKLTVQMDTAHASADFVAHAATLEVVKKA